MKGLPMEFIQSTCKIGQEAACCRYLVLDPYKGFQCGKLSPSTKAMFDARVKTMSAQGDNCEGVA